MKRRTNPWPAFVDLFSALLIATFAGLIMFSGAFQKLKASNEDLRQREKDREGNIVLLKDYVFTAGEFDYYPYTRLINPAETRKKISGIASEYATKFQQHYVLVIGHSSTLDAKDPDTHSTRQEKNWNFAGERAAIVADLLRQEFENRQELNQNQWKDKILVMSSGEFDLKLPSSPEDQANAYVEVYFLKEWEIPSIRNKTSLPVK
jgi:hypothetical protein